MKKITVTIKADITLEANEKEEIILDKIDNMDTDFEYDRLQYRLASLLASRISNKMKDLKDVEVLDIGYWE
jgi:hypothetical protein